MMLRRLMIALGLSVALPSTGTFAQNVPIKLGVMNDVSGVYADFQGVGSAVAARLAVEDFGGKVNDRPVEVVLGDHQNKVDIGTNMARQWFDRDGVELILDVPNSAIALSVNNIAREKNKVFIASGGVTSELTGKACSPNTVQWTFDNWSLANGLVQAVVATGGDTWFFLTSDYAFGHDLERSASAAVANYGGKVVGGVRHPLGASDFSSFVLQAQSSKAKVIALANAGGDTTNAVKQAAEFGLTKAGQRLAGLVFGLNNVQALGAQAAQGLVAVSPFYWNMNEGTRAFAKRFQAAHPKHNMPNEMQAGVYAAVLHYLKAVKALNGDTSGDNVVAKMKEIPTDDPLFGKGTIRVDGRKMHPMYLLEVKASDQAGSPWDYFKVTYTIPAEKAFRPLKDGGCSLAQ